MADTNARLSILRRIPVRMGRRMTHDKYEHIERANGVKQKLSSPFHPTLSQWTALCQVFPKAYRQEEP